MDTQIQKGHQGDVQFKSIISLPATAKPIAHTPLALGEHSGHMHVITGDVKLYENSENRFAVIGKKGAILQHVHEKKFNLLNYADLRPMQYEDHKPVLLKPNQVIQFGIHKKYNPFAKIFEKVID